MELRNPAISRTNLSRAGCDWAAFSTASSAAKSLLNIWQASHFSDPDSRVMFSWRPGPMSQQIEQMRMNNAASANQKAMPGL
jgi:hypothetical protein